MDLMTRRSIVMDAADRLDPRIGVLNSGKHYAYIDGRDKEPFTGTRAEVEAKLGIRSAAPAAKPAQKAAALKEFTVRMTFQYPAHDERDGLLFTVAAANKADAIKAARREAERDGHAATGKGRYTFRVESEG